MGQTFTWLGGSLSSPASWSQSDPKHPVEPGATDTVNIVGSGTVSGGVTVGTANVSGTFTLAGSILTGSAGGTHMGAGTLTIANGASFGGFSMDLSGGKIIQNGGAVTANTAAFDVDNGGTYEFKDGTIDAAGSVLIGNLGSGSMTQSGGTDTAKGIQIFSGSYTLNKGNLNVGSFLEYIGDKANKTGEFDQTGGKHTIAGSLQVGDGDHATGIFDLSGGSLKATSEYIGQNGTGTVKHSGGATTVLSDRIVLGINLVEGGTAGNGTYTFTNGDLSVGVIFVGSDAGCDGTFDYNTGKKVRASLTINGENGLPGLIVGGQGNGTFNDAGGALSTTLSVGYRTGSTGVYNLGDATLTSTNEVVGDGAKGTFNQNIGNNELKGATALQIGLQQGSNGTYRMESGILGGGGEQVGVAGKGSFSQTGGTNNAVILTLGVQRTGDGTYKLFTGGTLNATKEIIGGKGDGAFIQAGGNNKVTGELTIGDDQSGTYSISGGTLVFAPTDKGAFILGNENDVKGGLTVSSTGEVKTPTLEIGHDGDGTLTVQQGGKVFIANSVKMAVHSVLDVTGGGVVCVGGGSAIGGTLVVGAKGELTGRGTIKGNVHDIVGAKIEAVGGTLKIEGNVDGTGELSIGSKAKLVLAGTDSNDVRFTTGGAGTLELSKPASDTDAQFLNMTIGDKIVLDGVTVTAAHVKDGVLTVTLSNEATLSYSVTGTFAGAKFTIATSGGDSTLTLVAKSNAKPAGDIHHGSDSFAFDTAHPTVSPPQALSIQHHADALQPAQHALLAIDAQGQLIAHGQDGYPLHLLQADHSAHIALI